MWDKMISSGGAIVSLKKLNDKVIKEIKLKLKVTLIKKNWCNNCNNYVFLQSINSISKSKPKQRIVPFVKIPKSKLEASSNWKALLFLTSQKV